MELIMPKVIAARARIRLAYDALQQRAEGEKLYVAYSGGKDSDTISSLCIAEVGPSGVEINYNATGIDPPEVVRHIKARYRAWEAQGIECCFNKPRENMHDLIVKKGPPTRLKRYCCEKLKEGSGVGRIVITGVRWAESARRAASYDVLSVMNKRKELRATYNTDNDIQRRITEHCTTRSRITINPIVDWLDDDVWEYLRNNEIPYCSLYDEGFKRLGCIGCPMASKGRYKEFDRWPHMRRYYMRAFAEFVAKHPEYGARYGWYTAEDVWQWWMEEKKVSRQLEQGASDD